MAGVQGTCAAYTPISFALCVCVLLVYALDWNSGKFKAFTTILVHLCVRSEMISLLILLQRARAHICLSCNGTIISTVKCLVLMNNWNGITASGIEERMRWREKRETWSLRHRFNGKERKCIQTPILLAPILMTLSIYLFLFHFAQPLERNKRKLHSRRCSCSFDHRSS